MKKPPTIVKVQIPIAHSDNVRPQALIYNEDESIMVYIGMNEDLEKVMGKEKKKFFHATLGKDGGLILGEEAPWQDW